MVASFFIKKHRSKPYEKKRLLQLRKSRYVMGLTTTERLNRIIDLSGQTFGRLTAIKVVGRKHKEAVWRCRCQCGNLVEVAGYALRSGDTKSCGCWKQEGIAERTRTHGLSKTRLYNTYKAIKARCYNPNVNNYARYGGRGIEMCEEWCEDYETFYEWAMAHGYDPEAPRGQCTIDRIDSNGNYEPSNCRWVTNTAQARNKRNNRKFSFNGETLTASEWSDRTGIKVATLLFRLDHGWSVEKALTVQPITGRNQTYRQGAIANEI